jgi:cobyrinic acid a,c-diamide synthase
MSPGFIVAAPRSGAGKTTVTLGLIAAFRRRGVVVRTAKSGPDYIDPAFHAAASGQAGVNLDSWAMPPALLDALVGDLLRSAPPPRPSPTGGEGEEKTPLPLVGRGRGWGPKAPDILIVESAMGLFDGVAAPPRRSGAAADLAARFGLPVLLVLDIGGQAQTAAAVARGFQLHDPAVAIAGVILNQVASERHRRSAAEAIAAIGLPVLGAMPRDPSLTLPERHLGLVQASEHPALSAHLDRLADAAERHLDLDAILAAALPPRLGVAGFAGRVAPPGQRIALAQDAAFSFVYPHILAGWRAAGAEILPFSPLADEPPPDRADAAWLPGGYPELHGPRLADAYRFRDGLRRFAETRPVHGECGGYMVLGTGLTDADGRRHAMTSLLSHSTSFAKRRLHLGYRLAVLTDPAATRIRGHEFHHSTLADPGDDAPYADLSDAAGTPLGPAGGRRGYVSGSFFHVIATEEPS